MTVTEYWDGDCTLVKAYREAQRLREEREDTLAWLHGRYIYDALRQVSPLFHDFVKGRPKEVPYTEEPYTVAMRKRKEEESREKIKQQGVQYMLQFAERFNKQFKRKKTGGEGT